MSAPSPTDIISRLNPASLAFSPRVRKNRQQRLEGHRKPAVEQRHYDHRPQDRVPIDVLQASPAGCL